MAPLLPLAAYERVLVALSGCKDSVACLLALLEAAPIRPASSCTTMKWTAGARRS